MKAKKYAKIAVVLEKYPAFRDAEDYLRVMGRVLKEKFGIDPMKLDPYRLPTLSLLPDGTYRCEFAVDKDAAADLLLSRNNGNKKILSIVDDAFTPPAVLKKGGPSL